MKNEVKLSLPEITKNCVVTIRLKKVKRFQLRLFLGILVMKLGLIICPFPYKWINEEVDNEQK